MKKRKVAVLLLLALLIVVGISSIACDVTEIFAKLLGMQDGISPINDGGDGGGGGWPNSGDDGSGG